jgi:hypothetical protein
VWEDNNVLRSSRPGVLNANPQDNPNAETDDKDFREERAFVEISPRTYTLRIVNPGSRDDFIVDLLKIYR